MGYFYRIQIPALVATLDIADEFQATLVISDPFRRRSDRKVENSADIVS